MRLEQLSPVQKMESLEQRLDELKKLLRALQKKAGNVTEKNTGGQPQGHLKITHKHGRPEFYHIQVPGSSRGQYIPAGRRDFAAELAQRL